MILSSLVKRFVANGFQRLPRRGFFYTKCNNTYKLRGIQSVNNFSSAKVKSEALNNLMDLAERKVASILKQSDNSQQKRHLKEIIGGIYK